MSGAGRLRDLFLLDPDVIFLNHGSFGACPRPVFEVYQSWQRELERQPVEFLGRRFKSLIREAREALAADQEYGAIDNTWEFVCEQRGASYIRAALPVPVRSAPDIGEAIWQQVTPRTRVLAVSHITSPTALILPVADLVRRAREHGIISVIDGAHAPGQIPVHLETLGADFYVANCHKWMCAPKGSAFLYARRAVQPLLRPLVVSWGWRNGFLEEQERQGTRDIAALTGLPALSPDGPEWYAQMVSIPLPLADGEATQRRLYAERKIEVPIMTWNDRRLLRISVQGYNARADIDALTSALAGLLAEPSHSG